MMDIWTAIETILEKNPGIKAKFFVQKVRDKTGLERSTIYHHLASFEIKGKIYRETGRYWLGMEKPGDPQINKKWGLIERIDRFLELRHKRKSKEKKIEIKEKNKMLDMLYREDAVADEIMSLNEDTPDFLTKVHEILKKHGFGDQDL